MCEHCHSEDDTRALHIDPALKQAGWGVLDGSRVQRNWPINLGRLEGHGRRANPLKADYVLIYRNHKLGIIEAKQWQAGLTEGVGQAKNYAAKMQVRFTYATNGQELYGIDMESGWEGETHYPTPQELWKRTFATTNDWRDVSRQFHIRTKVDRGACASIRRLQSTACWSGSPMDTTARC